MTKRGIFVTGTDTGAGKTLVSAAILAALARRGMRVAAFKPMETGCRDAGHGLIGEDCEKLAAAANAGQQPADVAAYLFREPAAPLVAAEAEGARIDPARLLARYEEIAAGADFVLVESAGGLMVPAAEGVTTRDIAKALGLPVLVVVASRLGCINHALLTFEALRTAHIPLAGYVMNEIGDTSGEFALALLTNRELLSRFAGCADLGAMPHLRATQARNLDELAAIAEASLSLDVFVCEANRSGDSR